MPLVHEDVYKARLAIMSMVTNDVYACVIVTASIDAFMANDDYAFMALGIIVFINLLFINTTLQDAVFAAMFIVAGFSICMVIRPIHAIRVALVIIAIGLAIMHDAIQGIIPTKTENSRI
jgi:hypothetical protein